MYINVYFISIQLNKLFPKLYSLYLSKNFTFCRNSRSFLSYELSYQAISHPLILPYQFLTFLSDHQVQEPSYIKLSSHSTIALSLLATIRMKTYLTLRDLVTNV